MEVRGCGPDSGADVCCGIEDWRPGDWRIRRNGRRKRTDRLRRRDSGNAERPLLSALAHAGRPPAISQWGTGPADEASSTRRCSGAGLRTDGMDVRSAGDQERVFEYREAGCDCATLQRKPVWDHIVATARWFAHRPAGGGVVDEVKTSRSGVGRCSAREVRMP